jgi:hypothetical protein
MVQLVVFDNAGIHSTYIYSNWEAAKRDMFSMVADFYGYGDFTLVWGIAYDVTPEGLYCWRTVKTLEI